jgi:hypothetical protein
MDPKLKMIKEASLRARRKCVAMGDGTYAVLLSHGQHAIIDARDRGLVEQYTWTYRSDGTMEYAISYATDPETGKRIQLALHRVIMGITDPRVRVVHLDRNGLNCTRRNLTTYTLNFKDPITA